MSRPKGFVSLDLLFSAIPFLLMLSHFLTVVWMASEVAEDALHSPETMGKLAAIADYAVKRGAVEKSGQGSEFLGTASYRPNLIDGAELSSLPIEEIRERMGLEMLSVGWEPGEGACIYRLALLDGEIRKLYVCGE